MAKSATGYGIRVPGELQKNIKFIYLSSIYAADVQEDIDYYSSFLMYEPVL